MTVGVTQGGILSPQLFLIMFNDLLQDLENEGFQVYAYADDLAIIGDGLEKAEKAVVIVEN